MKKKTKLICSLATIAVILALLYVLQAFKYQNGMLIAILQKSAILAIVAVSMNLLNGFTGLFSLGQAGFMSIGAYVTAILIIPVKNLKGVYYATGVSPALQLFKEALESCPPWLQSIFPFLALIVGGCVAAAFAALIGMPVLRLKSDYLAIATLGFSEIIRAVFSSPQLNLITNGSYGLNKIPTFPDMFGGLVPSLVTPFLVSAICITLMVLLIRSSYGRAFKAIREDEIAAEAMGINLLKHKGMSFVISSFFTAIAGGLLAMFMNSIEAKTFSIGLTYDIPADHRHRRYRQRYRQHTRRFPRHRQQGMVAPLLRSAARDWRMGSTSFPHRLSDGYLLAAADGGCAVLSPRSDGYHRILLGGDHAHTQIP